MIERPEYLRELISFKDKDLIKIISGRLSAYSLGYKIYYQENTEYIHKYMNLLPLTT